MGLSSKLRMDQLKLSFTSPPWNTFLEGQAWKLKCSRFFFLFEKRRWDLVGCSWKNVERWSPNHRGRVSSDSSPWPEIETALESKVQNIEKLQMQSSVIVVIGVSNSLVYMTSSPKPQLFKSERCETQSHIVNWVSSSIFTWLFVCLVVRLHGDISIHLHLVMF